MTKQIKIKRANGREWAKAEPMPFDEASCDYIAKHNDYMTGTRVAISFANERGVRFDVNGVQHLAELADAA